MIIKFLTTYPTYENPKVSEDENTLQLALEETLELYHDHIYMPIVQRHTDILSITPYSMRDGKWVYIDNISEFSVNVGYQDGYGYGTFVDIKKTSGEVEELAMTDTTYLLNDNGKTIETILKPQYIHYDPPKVKILKGFIDGKYNQGELFRRLDLYYSNAYEDADNPDDTDGTADLPSVEYTSNFQK